VWITKRSHSRRVHGIIGAERHWLGYVKGLPAVRLANRIDAAAVRQAAAVEPGLADFLTAIGFL
jgi:hypothetical protein